MQKKPHFQYRDFQKIKAQEFEKFFASLGGEYQPYLNHLGELTWMTDIEAREQHEFFDYHESVLSRLKKRLPFHHYPNWQRITRQEQELRLQFRRYLEKRYLGEIRPETARMTPDYWQDEISDEEIESIPITMESYESIDWNKALIGLLAFLLIFSAVLTYFWITGNPQQTGSIIVESNVRGASIYLDDAKRGYADYSHLLSDVPYGVHRVSLKKTGYEASPPSQQIEISGSEPVKVFIEMRKIESRNHGYLQIFADESDSKVFIDNDYVGILQDQSLLYLPRGEHTVALEKSGFLTQPGTETVTVAPGDTARVSFSQKPEFTRTSAPSSKPAGGTLEITSNLSGARILLNGNDTGKETDHVFTDITLGSYVVKVVKKGYSSIPPEHRVALSGETPSAEISFQLLKEFEEVAIRTNPPNGNIYIDGEFRSKGFFKDDLKIGAHEISFGPLPGYKTPSRQSVDVRPNQPINLKVDYFPEVTLVAEITEDGNVRVDNCEVMNGFTFDNRGFSASSEAGPEVVFVDDLKSYFWKFGFAFPYRSPKGNDALKLSFRLPQETGATQKFILKMAAAAAEERYPLAISRKIDIKIKFNGKILNYVYRYQPKTVAEAGGMEAVEWDVSQFVRPGLNSIEIATTEENNTYYLLKRITLSN